MPYDERKCIKCNSSSLGDEFHYLLECNYFARERHMFLKKYFYKHPNIIKYKQLMTSTDTVTVKNLSKMLDVILKVFETDNSQIKKSNKAAGPAVHMFSLICAIVTRLYACFTCSSFN